MIAIILIMFGILGLGMIAIAIGAWTDNDIILKIGIIIALFIVGTAFLSMILGGIALLKG